MRPCTLILAVMLLALRLPAQSNGPVRLAVISESGDTSAAADVLTTEFSPHEGLQLLERNEIEKVYREQGLSAGNRDDLKLGRILGADGLLLMGTTMEGTNQVLNVRLVAIKPGVTLVAEKFSWPVTDLAGWSANYFKHLSPLLPKLSVLVKDAIPISVVNLRSATQSPDTLETERELKLLAIQRLSQERQFFVLERQSMQLLSGEKELKADDSPFWSGSYLLEGVVDQNGYSQDKITIDARLTPSKGGAPLLFAVSGNRTNFSEVINALADKVAQLLEVQTTVNEWSAADEAKQFYDEATWALHWGVYSEAQAAADSAWALGKHDLNCALVRIRAYAAEVPEVLPPRVESITSGMQVYNWVNIDQLPDPKNCESAIKALKYYYDFSRSSEDGVAAVLSKGKGWNDWHNSDWYQTGLDSLLAASSVLRHYNYLPESQKPVADKLAELRSLSRDVAELISKAPTVHDSYFVGERLATADELNYTIYEHPNIFRCQVKWGCFWQEKPENAVAMYRELMSSPVFSYIHKDLWMRSVGQPRLVAWNQNDRQRIPDLWNGFIREQNMSTNILLQLEAKAIALTDARGKQEIDNAFTNFFDAFLENREILVTNLVDVMYLNWGAGDLLRCVDEEDYSGVIEPLEKRFYSEYRPKMEAMEQEYDRKTVPAAEAAAEAAAVFPKQKQYLKEFKAYDAHEFVRLFTFESRKLSKSQALELQPLAAAYRSNLTVISQNATGIAGNRQRVGILQVTHFEADLNRIINPPQGQPLTQKPIIIPMPVYPAPPPETFTNILFVNKFLHFPFDRIKGEQVSDLKALAQYWSGGKFFVHLAYSTPAYQFDKQGNWQGTSSAAHSVIAVFDPGNENSDMINCPEDFVPGCTILFRGSLYVNGNGSIEKFDFGNREWRSLSLPAVGDCGLSVVDGRLFATTREAISEITDDGKGSHLLASVRRRPASSALDSLDDLGSPAIFSGPNHLPCACIGNTVFSWNGQDWREVLKVGILQTPEIFDDAVIFRAIHGYSSDDSDLLWIWRKDASPPELCLFDWPLPHPGINEGLRRKPLDRYLPARWHSLKDSRLTSSAATYYKSNLYFLVDHAEATNVAGIWTVPEKDGYHAKLVCLSPDCETPIVVPLKFDTNLGRAPLKSLGEKIEPWLALNQSMDIAPQMHFSESMLYLSQRNIPGIWAVPVSELEPAMAAQKQVELAKIALAKAAAEKARQDAEKVRKNLIAKYDLNHDGIIDREEREEALDDPAFIESELDIIDTNHNGWLDAEELVYFDANTNKILDPKELAGINIAEHLLAERLLKKFDAYGAGFLDRADFNDLCRATFGDNTQFALMNQFPDRNHEGAVDLGELEAYLTQRTRSRLRVGHRPGPVFMDPMRGGPGQPVDSQQAFKTAVEFYWQNPGATNRGPPFNGRSAAGGAPITNGTPGGRF